MSEFVVVDASVAFKWLVEEENSDKATDLAGLWDDEGAQPAASRLTPFEVANALHRRVARGELSLEIAAALMQYLMSLGVALHATPAVAAGRWNLPADSSRARSKAPITRRLRKSWIAKCGRRNSNSRARQVRAPTTHVGLTRSLRWNSE